MIVECPHCHLLVVITELNCAIFRHAILRTTYEQIDPHLSRAECEDLISQNKIFGCGKPFRVVNGIAETCDYI
jgi:hypothetical protein